MNTTINLILVNYLNFFSKLFKKKSGLAQVGQVCGMS